MEAAVIHYFAYGSNMSTRRLRARAPSCRFLARGTLKQYQLRFHKRSIDGSAKCDAFFTGNAEDRVLGVLFEIAPYDKPKLDRAEGLGNGYNESSVRLLLLDKSETDAIMYFSDPSYIDDKLLPTQEYLQFVVDGATEHGLPDQYIQAFVTSIATYG
jgi:hypothetical protein